MTAATPPALQAFSLITDCIRDHARQAPHRLALREGDQALSYAQLDAAMDRVAASLQRDGLKPGDAIAICAANSVDAAVIFLGALRAGLVVAPLAPGAGAASLSRMLDDAEAQLLFADESLDDGAIEAQRSARRRLLRIAIGPQRAQAPGRSLESWLAPAGAQPKPVKIAPDAPFNIIYSSGTTGEPKGIVQPHRMRWAHVMRAGKYGYGPRTVTLLSTPLYSNTTLVVFFPTLAFGGCVALMRKFDARGYLELAEQLRVTHTMLVPVQYRRLMALPEFDGFDLSSFEVKFSTSAPFGAELKADVLQRWPGGLVEFYGMTEGGGTCILDAHLHPTKLHTVGRPAEGHDIRLIDEQGREVRHGEAGEVVGHSAGMMKGYHRQPDKTREAEWFAPNGQRFIRTGDIGRFDEDGFLVLFDRRKDMIISGGFNIYPSDLEAVLRRHPAVEDVSVVGVPSEEWGETPVAFVVRKTGHTDSADSADSADSIRQWANAQLGKTQRISGLCFIAELPRSAIGKVLKRELRDQWVANETPGRSA